MRPVDPQKPSINPRELLRSEGPVALARLLATTGYMVQQRVLNDTVQSIMSSMPLLAEGDRGGGKTALAEAVADACNLPVFYLQGMEGLSLADVLYSWDGIGQETFVRQALESGDTLLAARERQWSAEFLVLGEALAAYELAAREGVCPILIIDEIDKLPERIEDMLLQLFGRGFASVPRFGDVGVKDEALWPIVFLLSNNIRHDLSAPLRSRCAYTWVDLPSPREGVAILCSRVPEAPMETVAWVAKMLDSIRDVQGVVDKPALREGISVLKALVRDDVKHIDEEVLGKYVCHLAKRHNDRDYLSQSLGRVVNDVNSAHVEIDAWVAEEFALRNRSEFRVAA